MPTSIPSTCSWPASRGNADEFSHLSVICHRVKFSGGLELLEFIFRSASDIWFDCIAQSFDVMLRLNGVT